MFENSFLFHKSPPEILVYIFNHKAIFIRSIYKGTDGTYQHIAKMIKIMEEHKILTTSVSGRKKNIKLTQKGYEVASNLLSIINILKGVEG